MKKVLLSWSSGKDSAWALHRLRQQEELEVVGLFSTVNQEFQRVSMHGVRIDLLERQAKNVDLPLEMIKLPFPCSNAECESRMASYVDKVKERGIDHFAFGDLYLEDVREYRERNLAGTGIDPIFPLWGLDTRELAQEMIGNGVEAWITTMDPRVLPESFAGRKYDASFLEDLPAEVDPCGENGEFHSFVCDGPMFRNKVDVRVGETVLRDGFLFADLLPEDSS